MPPRAQERDISSPQEKMYVSELGGVLSGTDIVQFALKYGNIKKIKCLVGWRMKPSGFSLKTQVGTAWGPSMWEPLWQDLTEKMIDSYAATQKPMLCRLVDTPTEFSDYTGVRAPVYNNLFILGNSRPRGVTTSATPKGLVRLGPTQFTELNKIALNDSRRLKYGRAIIKGVKENVTEQSVPVPDSGASKAQSRAQLSANNLYTSGNDFVLPTGEKYKGMFHLYMQENGELVAMAGSRHADKAHAVLTPVSNKAHRMVNPTQNSTPAGTSIVNNPGKHGPHGGGFTGGGGSY